MNVATFARTRASVDRTSRFAARRLSDHLAADGKSLCTRVSTLVRPVCINDPSVSARKVVVDERHIDAVSAVAAEITA